MWLYFTRVRHPRPPPSRHAGTHPPSGEGSRGDVGDSEPNRGSSHGVNASEARCDDPLDETIEPDAVTHSNEDIRLGFDEGVEDNLQEEASDEDPYEMEKPDKHRPSLSSIMRMPGPPEWRGGRAPPA